MPLLNSPALIRLLAVMHLTAAYYLLTSPTTVTNHSFVTLMGASMGLPAPPPPTSSNPLHPSASSTPAYPLAAAFLALLALIDLSATTQPAEIYSHYFSSQAPIRLLFFFSLTGWGYLSQAMARSARAGAGVGAGIMGRMAGQGFAAGGNWDGLSSALVFTWGFVQMVWWFWIYVTLRDERRELLADRAVKQKAEADRNM